MIFIMARGSKGSIVGGIPENTFPIIRPGNSQKIAFTGTSQQSSAFGVDVSIVQIFATEDCYIKIGADPTANTTTSSFVPSGFILYYNAVPGEKIAVIRSTANGTLYITEGEP